ncbi:hypothetical protein GCM10009646_79180 [Streptomyces aureus]
MMELVAYFFFALYAGWFIGLVKGWSDRAFLALLVCLFGGVLILLAVSLGNESAGNLELAPMIASGIGWFLGPLMGESTWNMVMEPRGASA